jgi:hypothetical protein
MFSSVALNLVLHIWETLLWREHDRSWCQIMLKLLLHTNTVWQNLTVIIMWYIQLPQCFIALISSDSTCTSCSINHTWTHRMDLCVLYDSSKHRLFPHACCSVGQITAGLRQHSDFGNRICLLLDVKVIVKWGFLSERQGGSPKRMSNLMFAAETRVCVRRELNSYSILPPGHALLNGRDLMERSLRRNSKTTEHHSETG